MPKVERDFAGRIVLWSALCFAAARSTTVTVALAGFDPAVEVDAGPIMRGPLYY